MLVLLLPVAAIVAGIVLIVRTRRLTARTTGVIVRHHGDAPVFRFTVEGRGEFEVKNAVSRSWPRPAPGTSVRVRYDPEEPQRAQLDQPGYGGTGAGVVFIVLGLVLLASALALA